MQEAGFARYAPQLNARNAVAIEVWNLLGGLDWAGLPMAIALYQIDDVPALVRRLAQIRDGMRS